MGTLSFTKLCSSCFEVKPISAFSKQKKHKDGLKYKCKECDRIYRQVHPRIPASNHRANLKYKYGITPEDYKVLFNKQRGCCAICGKHQSKLKKSLGVDHDHTTGKIRGLLCPKCNFLLGYIKDSRRMLLKAMQYLRQK